MLDVETCDLCEIQRWRNERTKNEWTKEKKTFTKHKTNWIKGIEFNFLYILLLVHVNAGCEKKHDMHFFLLVFLSKSMRIILN